VHQTAPAKPFILLSPLRMALNADHPPALLTNPPPIKSGRRPAATPFFTNSRESLRACKTFPPQRLMKVICHKRPRKTGSFSFDQDSAESIQKIVTVGIIKKIVPSINSPDNDMVQCSRGVRLC